MGSALLEALRPAGLPCHAGAQVGRPRSPSLSGATPTATASYRRTRRSPAWIGCPCPAANAVDGSLDTRWAGRWSDLRWIQADLGSTTSFDHVQPAWEAAYATSYTVQTSDNGQDRNTVHARTAGNRDLDDTQTAGNARHARVSTTERGTPWGYSLYEFGVYRS